MPAAIGAPQDQIDTPALVVDLDAIERNLLVGQPPLRRQGGGGRPAR
jgi:D-serine deaminase-like pyridoxal phosphate-dependent protein